MPIRSLRVDTSNAQRAVRAVSPRRAHSRIPPQAPPGFAYDTFTGNPGDFIQNRLEGGSWVNATGGQTAILTSGGRAHGNGAGECDYYNSSPPPSPDQTVTVDIFVATAVGYAAVEARCTANMANRYEIVFHPDTVTYNLRKVIAGIATNLGTYHPTAGVGPGGTTTVTLIALGSTLMAIVDGLLCMTAVDTDITAANFTGFLLESTSGTTDAAGLGLDNFSANNGSSLALISGSETGTGSDAVAVITITASESGTGTEAVSGLFLSGQNESVTGAEAVGGIALVTSETGVGTESALPTLPAAETGGGAEAVTGLTLSAVAETGSGVEAVSGLALSGQSQTGSGAESVASIALAASDTGSGAESALPILTTAESGSGTESVSGIALSRAETATVTEAVSGLSLTHAESATGTETVGIALTNSDSGAGAEAAGITLSGVGETGSGTQTVSGLTLAGVSDAATGAEATPQIALAASETGASTESAQVVGQGPQIITASESGAGTEAAAGISLSATESGAGGESASGIGLTASEAGIAADQLARITLVTGEIGSVLDGVLVILLGAVDGATVIEHATVAPVGSTIVVPTLFTTTAMIQHVYATSAIAGGASESLVIGGHDNAAALVDDHVLTVGEVRGVDYALVESTTKDGS